MNDSLFIKEYHGESDNYSSNIMKKGLHIKPSKVTGRNESIKGFFLTSQNDSGKIIFSDPEGFLNFNELGDVSILKPQNGDSLSFINGEWKNIPLIVYSLHDLDISPLVRKTITINNSENNITTPFHISIYKYEGEGIPYVYISKWNEEETDIVICNLCSQNSLKGEIELLFK